jgi:lipopolysaccharide/colanic/teichoic acid biosynthesis glycosyltransferase
MACARPTVLAIDGVARRLVCDEAGAGIFATPEDPESLAAAIESLADDEARRETLGRSGRAWVLANATREALAERYAGILEGMPRARREPSWGYAVAKRGFDVAAALVLGILLAPLLLGLALAVRIGLGGPVLFRQERLGRNGRPFRILKFRTMRSGSGSDAERLTRLGRWLRSTSLDELPELWSVLRGEMSLVGPRPLLPQYRSRYTFEQFRRHDVTPGITGWAQVNGRNALTWEEKFRLDLEYVEHASFSLDLAILARTAGAVFGRRGVSAPGEATMPEFQGTGKNA